MKYQYPAEVGEQLIAGANHSIRPRGKYSKFVFSASERCTITNLCISNYPVCDAFNLSDKDSKVINIKGGVSLNCGYPFTLTVDTPLPGNVITVQAWP